jgi:hypothetical protein
MLLKMDEEAVDGVLPAINGWNIAGEDGWEGIAMVPDRERISRLANGISNVKYKHRKHERVVVTMTTNGF